MSIVYIQLGYSNIHCKYGMLYSGNFRGGKFFANFEGLCLFAKVFSLKFVGVASIGGTTEQSVKVFSTNIVVSTNSRKFSPSKVFRYMVCCLHSRVLLSMIDRVIYDTMKI